MLLTISLLWVYFFILVCYNNKFGINILYEQPFCARIVILHLLVCRFHHSFTFWELSISRRSSVHLLSDYSGHFNLSCPPSISFQKTFLVGAGFFFSVFLMAFATESGKNSGFLVKNFWISLGGFLLSALIMTIFESPKIPKETGDRIFFSIHLVCVVSCNWFCISSLKYISATNVALINAFQVPLQLIAQLTFLDGYVEEGTGTIQVAGALIVFLAVFTRPLLHIYFTSSHQA